MKVPQTKEAVKAEVLGRLTGKPAFEKKDIFPGMYYWRVPSKRDCAAHCGETIIKGEEEISLAYGGNQYGSQYNHYHKDCFLKEFGKVCKKMGWKIK